MSSKLTVLVFVTFITIGYGVGYGQYGYPGSYGSGYPGGYRPEGPPGAHPGCPLCDSSVYSYCSHKHDHDSCCCNGNRFHPFTCRLTDCKFLYADSCKEHHLIANCCCVDLEKNAVPVAPLLAPVIAA